MGCCDTINCVLDITYFRTLFPYFSDVIKYPDATIEAWWNLAKCYFNDSCRFNYLSGDCVCQALYLMTAHLGYLSSIINGQGGGSIVPGLKNSATIDKVSVSLTMPPFDNQFQWWLMLSGYGQELLALLQIAGIGGMYIGGLPETQAIRKVGGIFWR